MKKTKFLIVVDMQNDFVDGSLGSPEAAAIIPAAARRITECAAEGYQIIATLDTHGPDYPDTSEGRKLPVVHCVKGTQGWALNKTVAEAAEGCLTVEKPTFGSLELPNLVARLSDGKPEKIELMGLCTDICVISNALILKARFPECDMSVRADCCAGVTPEKHLAALEAMASCQIDVVRP